MRNLKSRYWITKLNMSWNILNHFLILLFKEWARSDFLLTLMNPRRKIQKHKNFSVRETWNLVIYCESYVKQIWCKILLYNSPLYPSVSWHKFSLEDPRVLNVKGEHKYYSSSLYTKHCNYTFCLSNCPPAHILL